MNDRNHRPEFVSTVIGGVQARELLLEALAGGPKTGLDLRQVLARKLKTSVSNARLYYNLQVLSNASIIRFHSKWRGKEVELDPTWLQPVREYFGTRAPIVCVGGVEARLRSPTFLDSALKATDIKPTRYYFVAREEFRKKVSGVPGNVKFVFVSEDILERDFAGLKRVFEGIIREELNAYEVIVDLSDGGRLGLLILYRLAQDYGLKRFYLPDAQQKVIWLP